MDLEGNSVSDENNMNLLNEDYLESTKLVSNSQSSDQDIWDSCIDSGQQKRNNITSEVPTLELVNRVTDWNNSPENNGSEIELNKQFSIDTMNNDNLTSQLENSERNVSKKIEPQEKEANDSSSFLENDFENIIDSKSRGNRKRRKKRIVMADSESDDENETVVSSASADIKDDTNEDTNVAETKRKNGSRLLHDDSDEENAAKNSLIKQTNSEGTNEFIEASIKKPHKRLAILDSDSEIDEPISLHNKSFADNAANKTAIIYTTNSNGELVPENEVHKDVQKSRLSMLCDSESSDEDLDKGDNEMDQPEAPLNSDEEVIKPKPYKKKSISKKTAEESKKMSAKEAAELRKEIKSESQRMVRETNVSLPYHKPKSHSLKEFLARRPKLSSAVPLATRTPPSVAIKMSMEQLKIVSEKLKKREKEVKEFYKSSSESENEDDKDYIPPGEKNQTKEIAESNTLGSEAMESSEQSSEINQNITPNVIEEKNNAQEITDNQKDSEDTGVKTQDVSMLENKSVEDNVMEVDNAMEDTEEAAEDLHQTTKEPVKDLTEVCDNSKICEEELTNMSIDSNKDQTKEDELLEKNNINASEEITKTVLNNKETQRQSMDYEFNLDDLEVNTENIEEKSFQQEISTDVNEEIENGSEKRSKKFTFTDLDEEIENFGKDIGEPSTVKPVSKRLSALDLIKIRLSNVTPRLSGGPDDIIDLDSGVAKPNEVTKLMERFEKHTKSEHKHPHKHKVKLNIVTVESGGDIHQETVAMNVEDEDTDVVEEKPGAKFQRLKEELQNQMAIKKSELWQQKSSRDISSKGEKCEGEKEDYEAGYEDSFLDDEDEEAELTDSEDSEEEEAELTEKEARKKSAFLDEEAEESDIEGDDENDDPQVEDEDMKVDLIEKQDEESKSSTISESLADEGTQDKNEEPPKKRVLKRIVKVFEDSDDEDVCITNFPAVNKNETTSTGKDGFDTTATAEEDDGEDDMPPPHQIPSNKTPVRQITQTKSALAFDFLTPISFMTGIQNLNHSASKSVIDSPVLSPVQINTQPSSFKEDNWSSGLQKNLFAESEITDSQNLEDLASMCSGQFPTTQETKDNPEDKSDDNKQLSSENFDAERCSNNEVPSTQDLLNICSGEFTGTTQLENKTGAVIQSTFGVPDNNEIKSLGEDQDLIISQLIDEEELENFRKKFDSPVITNSQRITKEAEEVMGGGRMDSDDDDEGEESKTKKKKKKRQQKLIFSDDEDSDEDDAANVEEEIDLHDSDGEDDEKQIDNIGYDSEENEIELDGEAPREKLKIADFLEAEAELSESDWGSADEDEKDLDQLEFELGDTEKFDENKMRQDIEKIHMRRMLDDDTREVKLLQELLLEDGEMHGTGRQRQFKWKNIDSIGEGDEESKKEDDEMYLDEEESEEQWRKKRHEREMFLQEKLKKSQEEEDDDALLNESQLLKIGQKILQRSQTGSQNSTPADQPKTGSESPVAKEPFSLLNKRGSFLSRGDQVLQRLAEYTKVSTTIALGTAKNSKSFLFQTVSTKEAAISITQNKKRKAADGTPDALKKLKLSSNLSPAVNKRKLDNRNKGKKLFSSLLD